MNVSCVSISAALISAVLISAFLFLYSLRTASSAASVALFAGPGCAMRSGVPPVARITASGSISRMRASSTKQIENVLSILYTEHAILHRFFQTVFLFFTLLFRPIILAFSFICPLLSVCCFLHFPAALCLIKKAGIHRCTPALIHIVIITDIFR